MNALQNGSRFNLFSVGPLAQEMNRFFDNPMRRGSAQDITWFSPVSVWEDDSTFYFEFDLPGVPIESIDVKVADNHLHVSAERPFPEEREYARQERIFGRFERSFKLTSRIDDNSMDAMLENGVLRITIAKAPEAQVKKIEIKSVS